MAGTGRVPLIDPETGKFPDEYTPQAVLDAEATATIAAGTAGSAAAAAASARDAAVAAKDAAEAVGTTNDTVIAAQINTPSSNTRTALDATIDAAVSLLSAAPDIATPSDSTGAGGQSDPVEGKVVAWPGLISEWAGLSVFNPSVPGERQGDIATRYGCPITFTVPGGVIPAGTTPFAVAIVDPSSSDFVGSSAPDPQSYFEGTFLGVAVWVRWDKTSWTMARKTAATVAKPVPSTGGVFRVVTARGAQSAILLSAGGRNWSTASLLAQTTRMIDRAAGARHVLLIPPIFRTASAANDTGLSDLAAAYGVDFYDMRTYLVHRGLDDEGITRTAPDDADIAANIVPAPLFLDGIHPTAAGQRAIARRLLELLVEKGWIAAESVYIPPRVIPLPSGPTKLVIPTGGNAVIASPQALQTAQQVEYIMHIDPAVDTMISQLILRRNGTVGGVTDNSFAIQTISNAVIRTQMFPTETPGGASQSTDSDAPTWPAGAFTLRVVAQANPRQVSCYLGPATNDFSSITWVPIGTVPKTGSATSIFPKDVPLRLALAGVWKRIQVKTGATVLIDQDFTDPNADLSAWSFTGGAAVLPA